MVVIRLNEATIVAGKQHDRGARDVRVVVAREHVGFSKRLMAECGYKDVTAHHLDEAELRAWNQYQKDKANGIEHTTDAKLRMKRWQVQFPHIFGTD